MQEKAADVSWEAKQVSLGEARAYLDGLDLSYIIKTMCAEHYVLPRWTNEDAQYCCKLYKNFLYLCKKHPSFSLVPTREIDEFWHNHILYTKNYWQDCLRIFGNYFHHEPASPSAPPEGLVHDFMLTKRLYLEEFNQPLGPLD